jgi:hypothetical protein
MHQGEEIKNVGYVCSGTCYVKVNFKNKNSEASLIVGVLQQNDYFNEHILDRHSDNIISPCTIIAQCRTKIGFIDEIYCKYTLGKLANSPISIILNDKQKISELYEEYLDHTDWNFNKQKIVKEWIKDFKKDPTQSSYDQYKSKSIECARKFKF